MMDEVAWTELEGSLAEDREQEFYWLWIFATLGYGVGDMITTLAVIDYHPLVQEGNALVRWLYLQWGVPGFVAGKLLVFATCFAISLIALKRWEDRLLYYFPPLLLTIIGGFVTGYNLFLMGL